MTKTSLLIPYIRQSKAKEKTISLDDQRAIIAKWAKDREGVKLAPEVVEQGVSGSKSWRERALGEVIERVERGEADGIIVAFQDRLSRENGHATAEVWETLAAAGARFVAAGEALDSASGDQEMLFTIKAAIAREQWKRHKANWAKANEHCARNGLYQGRTPVGYTKGRATSLVGTDPDASIAAKQLSKNEHADIVADVFKARADGRSWASLAGMLNDAKVPTAEGGTWGLNSVRSMISNPIYKGELSNGETHRFPEYVIVLPSAWDAAQPAKSAAAHPYAQTVKDTGSWAVLGGLLLCGGTCADGTPCGHRLTPTTSRTDASGKAHRYYVCRNSARGRCTSRAIANATEIEDLVVSEARSWFERAVAEGRVGIGADADVAKVAALEIEAENARAAARAALEAAGIPASDAIIAQSTAVQAAEAAVADAAGARRMTLTPEQWAASYDDGSFDDRRALVRKLVAGCTVYRKGTVVEVPDVYGDGGEGFPESLKPGKHTLTELRDRVEIRFLPIAAGA